MTGFQLRHLGLQVLRRGVQLGVVVLVFALVFLSLYAHYRAARVFDDPEALTGWKDRVLLGIDQRLAGHEGVQEFLDGNKGTLWSMRVGGIDLTDPLAAAEMTAASRTLYVPFLLSTLIPVAVTLLLGKVFCSWICPAGLLLELTGKLRKLLRLAELPPAEVRFSNRNKYVLLGAGLLVAGVIGLPIFALVYPPAVLSRLAHAWIFGTAFVGMLVLAGVIIVFELFVSPRWWCRTMCPGGALYGLIGWPRLLRVRVDPDRCTSCGECVPVCEPGLHPVLGSAGIECDNCGVCIRHCPDQALRYTVGLPGRKHSGRLRGGSQERQIDRPRAVDSAAAKRRREIELPVIRALALFALAAAPAQAHHILGIPHYSYKENYPQAPTLEYPATTGPYDVLLTAYPGSPVPGEPANLVFYIKNRQSGVPYERPVTVRVLQTFTFGRNRAVQPTTLVQPFDVAHKLSVTMPEDGEYVVELTLDVEGQTEVIPFLMVAGQPTAAASIVAAVGLGLAVFVIVVRAIKIKRDRRARRAAAGVPPGVLAMD